MGNTFTTMELGMKAIGRTICSMGQGGKNGLTGPVMKGNTWKGRNMEKGSIYGTIDQNTMENGRKTK